MRLPPRVRSILVIAQRFPPAGGEVSRWNAARVLELAARGWRPTVLTTPSQMQIQSGGPPEWALLTDVTGCADIVRIPSPEVLRVHPAIDGVLRARARPDTSSLWNPGAELAARAIHRSARFEAIFAAAPPYSALALAHRLGRALDVPYVLALREGWRPAMSAKVAARVTRKEQRWLEGAATTLGPDADGEAIASALRSLCP